MKKLYKSHVDKKIAGVCGGIAQVLGIDSTIVRGIWAISVMFFGISAVLYVIVALLLPYNDVEVLTNRKKLCKSTTDVKVFGVCGGIAEYLNIDSTIVRITFVILILFFGIGLAEYLILAWIMPRRDM